MTKTIFFDEVKNSVIEGETFNKFLDKQIDLNEIEKENLRTSSINILSKCVKSNFENDTAKSNTGLIIGKIQSGKKLCHLPQSYH